LQSASCCDSVLEANRYCYRAQCFETTKAIAQKLDLPPSRYTVSFQSRLGKRPWIRPYTDKVIVDLAQKGCRRLAVIEASFVADCLEALEEIGIRGKNDFLKAGGE